MPAIPSAIRFFIHTSKKRKKSNNQFLNEKCRNLVLPLLPSWLSLLPFPTRGRSHFSLNFESSLAPVPVNTYITTSCLISGVLLVSLHSMKALASNFFCRTLQNKMLPQISQCSKFDAKSPVFRHSLTILTS